MTMAWRCCCSCLGHPVTGWPREGNKTALLDLLARGRAPASIEK
ncbi:hypothetical protein [Massilia sp. HP4]|nr:hypothetical protein [Massilia sp. HP4]